MKVAYWIVAALLALLYLYSDVLLVVGSAGAANREANQTIGADDNS